MLDRTHHVRQIKYQFEYTRRLKACFVGAGGHSFRNVYPALRYAPVDLAAVSDIALDRAQAYARLFGGERAYSDHREMLERERPDLVFIVTSYHPDGRVQATDIAKDVLAAGAHVWMEKPTAASLEEVRDLSVRSKAAGRQVMTGLKKIFFPAIEKLGEIAASPEFGRLSSLYLRYPQALPAPSRRGDLVAMESFLDHIYHPAAILNFLAGPISRATYEWESHNGGCVLSMRFASGAIGTAHFAAGSSGSSPFERVEVIGENANAVVDNGTRLTYYRRADLPTYGRAASFIQPEANAPLHWEPENSLGQLYNNNMFFLGYVPEILHLCDAILESRQITKGTLENVIEIMKLFEFFRSTDAGVTATI
ncbi:MAG: Gfo/Idh/MocA family oxidoreductase [Rhodospirillales bacterium]|nr:Gfo/Idh/MocA family oxidoreductase [Rhodospirillales bacterium]